MKTTDEPSDIDTMNKCFVAAKGNDVVFLQPVPPILSTADALLLAAWLVAITGEDEQFARVLAAVEST